MANLPQGQLLITHRINSPSGSGNVTPTNWKSMADVEPCKPVWDQNFWLRPVQECKLWGSPTILDFCFRLEFTNWEKKILVQSPGYDVSSFESSFNECLGTSWPVHKFCVGYMSSDPETRRNTQEHSEWFRNTQIHGRDQRRQEVCDAVKYVLVQLKDLLSAVEIKRLLLFVMINYS